MFGAPGPLRRSKTQRLFLLSAGFLRERLPVVVSHNEATPPVLRLTRAASGQDGSVADQL
jgi:hypothetical protein